MSVTHLKRKNRIRAGRQRKAIGKAVETTAELASTSGGNLIYAGYPCDPYA